MAKGGNFENTVCRKLSLWWTNGERDDVFTRTGGSGGKFTARKKSGKNTAFQSGDITFADPIGERLIKCFNIECKTGYGKRTKDSIKKWDLLELLDSRQKEPVFMQMWNQCCEDAEKSERAPLLIFRRNQMEICIAMYEGEFIDMGWERADYLGIVITVTLPHYDEEVVVLSLKDFTEWIKNPQEYFKRC